MEDHVHNQLTMLLAVKTVCEAKPTAWQSAEAFADAYADFCTCIENIIHLQPANGVFSPVTESLRVELEVAERILTMEMDELIEQFEAADVGFVDDYTAARSMTFPNENHIPVSASPE